MSTSVVPDIETLVASLQAKTGALLTAGASADDARRAALAAAQAVVARLETPEEVIMRYANVLLGERMSLKFGVDLRIFHLLAEAEGRLTSAQLAAKTGAEELLIVRVMRVICSIGFADEVDIGTYSATPRTIAMTQPGMEGAVVITHDFSATAQLADYFKAKGYQCPTDSHHAAFQWVHKTDKTYFEAIHSSPAKMAAFNAFMGIIRAGRKFWADWYDVEGRLLSDFGFGPDETFLVDIGGGHGHDLETLVEKFPRTAGHLVLQDLDSVVRNANIRRLNDAGIKTAGHDFFTEQPLKGAKVYFMHFCLHDWPNQDCRTILRHIMAAMRPGYSRLVLNEAVLPNRDCPSWFATNDLNLMAILGGLTRSEQQWAELLESVGLEVVKVWTSPFPNDSEGVIEAMLKT